MADCLLEGNEASHFLGSFAMDEMLDVLGGCGVDMSFENAIASEDYSRLTYNCAEQTQGRHPHCPFSVLVVQNAEGIFEAFSNGQHDHCGKKREDEEVKNDFKISPVFIVESNAKAPSLFHRIDEIKVGKASSTSTTLLPPTTTAPSSSSSSSLSRRDEKFQEFLNELLTPRKRHAPTGTPKMTHRNGQRCVISCSMCPATLNSPALLNLHRKCHGSNGKFKCPQCSYSSNLWKATQKHMRLHGIRQEKPQSNGFQCDKCPAAFLHPGIFSRHKKLHGAKHPYPCTKCDYSCQQKITLQQHLIVHGLAKPLPRLRRLKDNPRKAIIPCAKCPAKFKTQHGLRKHTRLHASDGKFSCGLCDLRSGNALTIEKHRELHGVYVQGRRLRGRPRTSEKLSSLEMGAVRKLSTGEGACNTEMAESLALANATSSNGSGLLLSSGLDRREPHPNAATRV